MRSHRITICLCVCALGCGDLFSHFGGDAGEGADASTTKDGGTFDGGDQDPRDAGSDAGAGVDAGASDAGTSDGGLPDGATPSDAGGADSGTQDAGAKDAGPQGDGMPLTWSSNLADAGDYLYTGVGGTSANDVYVLGTSQGIVTVSHWDGTAMTAVFADPTLGLGQGSGFWVSPSGAVYAGGQNFLMVCKQNCATGGTYSEFQLDTSFVMGLCGTSDTDVYAVGYSGGLLGGMLWKWDGAAWPLLTDAGVTRSAACWVAPNGDLFVSGTGAVAHHTADGTLVAIEPAPSPLDSSTRLQGVWGAGGQVFAVGDEESVAARDPSGTWSVVLGPQLSAGNFQAVGGIASNELWAGGFPGMQAPQYSQAHFFDGAWSYTDDFAGLLDIHAFWAADANTVFVAGQQLDSLGGIVGAGLYVGTR